MTRFTARLCLLLAGCVLWVGCKNKATDQPVEVPPAEPVAVDESAPLTAPPAAYEPQPVAPQPAPPPDTSTYVVQKGDTLWSIARRVYGDGQRWKDIAAANGITDPTKIRVGQSLILP